MKKYILKGIAALAVAASMVSCSSDYLDQPPVTEISDDQIAQSVEGARAALYGLCQAMYIGQYGDWLRMSNGEGYVRTVFGDSGSPDFFDSWLAGSQKEFQIWALMRTDSNIANTFPWAYCYNLIFQANVILREIDSCPGSKSEVDFIKAQALAIRAHAYTRLMQIYGPRYEDSANGEALCVVLRMQTGNEDLPLSSYKDCIKAIYDDLDNAIELFEGSTATRSYGFEPDVNVARALYSRIALLNHDWQKAKDMAHDARAEFPIMTAAEFKGGFAEHNGEWLWYNLPDKKYNGYNSWGASFSCNGGYATAYNWAGAGNISWDFYKECYAKYPDDVRLELFWTPDKANKYANLGIKEEDFWNKAYVNNEFLFCYGLEGKMSAAVSLFMSHNTPAGYSGGYDVDV
ncbi:MAG: RagB/SusD family nutrient uptake outer membrane protein, partial [Muribaculaceae bacterium]|nr:RagB/SusD family nutrient uptake outer membrane protein [Muribaculaceae bacterium]